MGETLFGILTNDEGVVRKGKRKERLKAICDGKQKAKEREEERVYRKWVSSQRTEKLVTENGIENSDEKAVSKDSPCTAITGYVFLPRDIFRRMYTEFNYSILRATGYNSAEVKSVK